MIVVWAELCSVKQESDISHGTVFAWDFFGEKTGNERIFLPIN